MIQHSVAVDYTESRGEGDLFRVADLSATNLHREMRLTTPARVASAAAMVNESREPWLVWCNTNYEADALKDAMPDACEIRGSDSADEKERKVEAFLVYMERVLISKPSITGFGVNFQHTHNAVFVGLSYSFEAFYQAIRAPVAFQAGKGSQLPCRYRRERGTNRPDHSPQNPTTRRNEKKRCNPPPRN